jgi:hypothetical protein
VSVRLSDLSPRLFLKAADARDTLRAVRFIAGDAALPIEIRTLRCLGDDGRPVDVAYASDYRAFCVRKADEFIAAAKAAALATKPAPKPSPRVLAPAAAQRFDSSRVPVGALTFACGGPVTFR